jgi:hypothetical protein
MIDDELRGFEGHIYRKKMVTRKVSAQPAVWVAFHIVTDQQVGPELRYPPSTLPETANRSLQDPTIICL